ncbi:MAG: ATP-binding protein, partial [Verrucomicrobiota bacterium]
QNRLGIEGFPAEGGLYETLISNSGLYDAKEFHAPQAKIDPCRLSPLWKETDKYFKRKNSPVDLTELYEIWRKPPFGVKEGMLPFFAVSYIMTRIHDYAAYLEGVYRPSIDDLFIDYLMKSPKDIALRPMSFTDIGQKILAGVCDVLNEIDPKAETLTETSEPLTIARRLVSTVINLPSWVLRTQQLSKNTIRLRELVKNANDPNKVLFDDLPHLFKEYEDNLSKGDVQPIIEEIKESLAELVQAYPSLLTDLSNTLKNELQIDQDGVEGYKELNQRAKNIMHVSGDFTLDAFAARLTSYNGVTSDIEGIASLAAGKPARDWIDLDVNRAKLRIAELAQQFNHTEAYGRVQNREDYRQAVAFMVGLNGKPKTYVHEFTIKRTAEKDIQEIESRIKNALNGHFEEGSDLLLAALANIGAEILERSNAEQEPPKKATA